MLFVWRAARTSTRDAVVAAVRSEAVRRMVKCILRLLIFNATQLWMKCRRESENRMERGRRAIDRIRLIFYLVQFTVLIYGYSGKLKSSRLMRRRGATPHTNVNCTKFINSGMIPVIRDKWRID